MRTNRHWTVEEIAGDPIVLHGREFIPVVKRTSRVWRRVTFGTHRSEVRGGGLVWLQPAALIERRPNGEERRIAIPDPTRAALGGMLVSVLALPLIFLIVTVLIAVLRWRFSKSDDSPPS